MPYISVQFSALFADFLDIIFQLLYFFLFWLISVTWGILVPQLGIESLPPALKVQSPNHWTIREAPNPCLFNLLFYFRSIIYMYKLPWWLRW